MDILIIGGGLSGLVAAWQLRSAGVNASIMEARTRFGGRILTVGEDDGADCDLGPSWFWPGQPLVAGLLDHFNIPSYGQFVDGAVLFQGMDGRIDRTNGASPMTGSRRIEGGINRLTNAIVNEIDASHQFLAHAVTKLSINKDVITVDATGPSGRCKCKLNRSRWRCPPAWRLIWYLFLSCLKKPCRH